MREISSAGRCVIVVLKVFHDECCGLYKHRYDNQMIIPGSVTQVRYSKPEKTCVLWQHTSSVASWALLQCGNLAYRCAKSVILIINVYRFSRCADTPITSGSKRLLRSAVTLAARYLTRDRRIGSCGAPSDGSRGQKRAEVFAMISGNSWQFPDQPIISADQAIESG